MNLNLDSIKNKISSKIVLQLYFIFFILLNIFDFLNFLSGDIDFFKKILSWILIGYVFYKASFSKIFVGYVNRYFDWMYMIGFCFIGIMKSIYHYVSVSDLNEYFVFGWFLKFFSTDFELFLTYNFLIGSFIVIITSIYLLKNYKPKKNSLIGSFNLSSYLKFVGAQYFILSAASLFFGLVVFNYIMEWFALAVDSIILVLGLIFYIFMYLHKHTKLNTDNILSTISNTGNNFYQNLITQFSNKKTFMIGVSFILLLHLLVDIGVYLVPFLTGLQNTLYGSFVVDSIPIFNFISFSESWFYIDMSRVGFEIISSISLFIIHMSSVVIVFLLMSLPFYYFYKNISFKKIKLSKILEILFLICFLIQLIVFAMPNLTNPITFSVGSEFQVSGVDLNTNSVLTLGGDYSIQLLIVLVLSLILFVESLYLIKSSINEFISKKVISTIVLVFFFGYILVFGYTTVSSEFENTFLKDNINVQTGEFDAIMDLYYTSRLDPINRRAFGFKEPESIGMADVSFSLFSTYDYNNPNDNHIDFIIFNITSINTKHVYQIEKHKLNAVFDEKFNKVSDYFENGEFVYIYKLGENEFNIIEKGNKKFYIENKNYNTFNPIELAYKSKMTNTVEFVRLVVLFIFYFGGLLVFVWHFYRSNIRSRED